MKELFFWKSWLPSEKRTVVTVLSAAFCTIGLMLIKIFPGTLANTVRWDILSQLSEIQVPVDQVGFGGWQYEISVPSTMVSTQFTASAMTPDPVLVHVVMLAALFGLSVILAALTTLPRFWYFTGLAIFTLALAFSRTEMLGVSAGWDKTLMTAALVLYAGGGYYLHAFRPGIGIAARIRIFTGFTAALYLLVAAVGTGPMPAFTFMAYSMPLWLTGTVVFLLWCAAEILYGLTWITTSRTTGMGKKALPYFLVTALLYLLTLLFAYIGNTGTADWGLTVVNPLVPGLLAALTGLYGIRLRCESAGSVVSFRETGFWLYAGLLIIAAAFVAYAAALSNDPLLEVVEDVVVNGQLGMGAAFLFYILVNFLPLFRKGLEVHKVLYKPLHFDLMKTRAIGFGLVVMLFSIQRLFPFHQGVAAYYNALGDLYSLTSEHALAEQYYKMSLQQEFQNHKANYALASLSLTQGDDNAATFYFRQATLKKPSPHAYIGLSNILLKDNLYFEALFNLKEGLRKFPQNGQLLNNLGLLYARTNLADSAYFYLNKAEGTMYDPAVPATNILYVMASALQPASLDSLIQSIPPVNDLAWQANRLAVQNLSRRFMAEPSRPDATPRDSLLSAPAYSYWLNYGLNQARFDSSLIQPLWRLADLNAMAGEELLLAALYTEFYSGNKSRALEQLLALAENSKKKVALYHKILGHWFLQLGLYSQAVSQFSASNDQESLVGLAVAHALLGQPETGVILLERLKSGSDGQEAISRLQENLTHLVPMETLPDSLLMAARKQETAASYLKALSANPFRPATVQAAVSFFGNTQKQPDKAFQVVVDALRFNESAPELWESYALLSLQLGLIRQAEEARIKVSELASPTGYTDFLTRYQSQKALVEKAQEEFRQTGNLQTP